MYLPQAKLKSKWQLIRRAFSCPKFRCEKVLFVQKTFDYYQSFKFHFKRRKLIPDRKMVSIHFSEDFLPGTPAKEFRLPHLLSSHVAGFHLANTFRGNVGVCVSVRRTPPVQVRALWSQINIQLKESTLNQCQMFTNIWHCLATVSSFILSQNCVHMTLGVII